MKIAGSFSGSKTPPHSSPAKIDFAGPPVGVTQTDTIPARVFRTFEFRNHFVHDDFLPPIPRMEVCRRAIVVEHGDHDPQKP